SDRHAVERHLRACPPCRSRVAAEHTVRDLIRAEQGTLSSGHAPAGLRERCAMSSRLSSAGGSAAAPPVAITWRARMAPLALVATLVGLVGGAFLYQLTSRSSRVLAAELTADHLKCFGIINGVLGTQQEPAAVESSMASTFGWR